jgi:hypothetical protein
MCKTFCEKSSQLLLGEKIVCTSSNGAKRYTHITWYGPPCFGLSFCYPIPQTQVLASFCAYCHLVPLVQVLLTDKGNIK